MIPSFIQGLMKLKYDYPDVIEQQRAQRLLYIVTLVFFASGAWILFITLPNMVSGQVALMNAIIPFVAVAISVILHRMINRGQALLAARIFVAFLLFASVPNTSEALTTSLVIISIMPIVLTSILLDVRSLIIVMGLVLLLVLRGVIFAPTQVIFDPVNLASVFATIVLSTIFLALFKYSVEQLTYSATELIDQTRRLTLHENENFMDMNSHNIVAHIINTLRFQLSYSYIRVILLDDNQQPMQTFYSSIGVERVTEARSFVFASNSAFQLALDSGTPQIIGQDDPDYLKQHLLPTSTQGMIIPARAFNSTVVLMDIQTESDHPLSSETLSILSLYANQVAMQLAFQQTMTTLQADISEQEQIIDQQQKQLMSIQNLQTQGISSDWQTYLEQRGVSTIGYDINQKRQISDTLIGETPKMMQPALEKGEIVVQPQGSQQLITVPIRLRNTTLGAISFTVPQELSITERKLDFIRSVTERLALALENKRLLEQTQTQAQRESTANEIGSMLLGSTDVQSVLQTAATHFNDALGAVTTQIYLQPIATQISDNQQVEDTV